MRVTSIIAHQAIKPKLPQRQMEVWGYLSKSPWCTASELKEAMRLGGSKHWQDAEKRLPDMERDNIVFRSPARVCSITGRMATTWHSSPLEGWCKQPRQETAAERIARLESSLAELSVRLEQLERGAA